jgi:hypothetical protein
LKLISSGAKASVKFIWGVDFLTELLATGIFLGLVAMISGLLWSGFFTTFLVIL